MKNSDLYTKYNSIYTSILSSKISKGNLRVSALIILAVFFIEPLIMYKYHRSIPFTLDYYLRQIKYFSFIIIPLGILLLWTNWREKVKQTRGYSWMGKFQVLDKQTSMLSYYLLLTPGYQNKIKVSRILFNKTRVGDMITINRNALGKVEQIKKLNGIKQRLKLAETKRTQQPSVI